MAGKRFTAEQIIGYLRQAEVMLGQGQSMVDVLRALDVTGNTYYRWRKEYGGLGLDQAWRLKQLEQENGRYGYKRITALLRTQGWIVNHKRVERIWRQEELKVPGRHKKKGRLYLNDGSCIRLRPCWPNHVWAYYFVAERLTDGTKIRTLMVVDEYTRECLSLRTGYCSKSDDVLAVLTELFSTRGIPDHIRSDNVAEFTAKPIRAWLARLGIKTLHIELSSPGENGYNESFNGRLRDECLNAETFHALKEAQVILEQWRHHYNHIRPHTSLGYKPPAPLARMKEGAYAYTPAASFVLPTPQSVT